MDLYGKEDIERLLAKLKTEGDVTLEEGSKIHFLIECRKERFIPWHDSYDEELTGAICKWYESVLENVEKKQFGNFVTSVPLMYGFFIEKESNKYLKELFNKIISNLPLVDRIYAAKMPSHIYRPINKDENDLFSDFRSFEQAGPLRPYKFLHKKLSETVPIDYGIGNLTKLKIEHLNSGKEHFAGPELVEVLALELLNKKRKYYAFANCVFFNEQKGRIDSKEFFLVSRDIAEPFERTLKECYWKIWERMVEEGIVINPNPMENNFGRLKGPWGNIKDQALEIFEKVYSDFEIEQRKNEEADKDIWVVDR